jgi:hypothetical protein
MKNILLLMISILIFVSCEKDDNFISEDSNNQIYTKMNLKNKYLTDFYKSETFNKMSLSSWFKADYSITKEKVYYILNENGVSVPIINLKIENSQGDTIGIIEALSYKNKKGITDYNILLRNFENFDFNKLTGSISLIDINSNLKYLNAKVLNKEIVRIIPYIQFQNASTNAKEHPMDTNGDGNVTFSECYAYANAACQTDPDCYTMCYLIGDAAGWVATGTGPLCQAAIASACVVTAWNN